MYRFSMRGCILLFPRSPVGSPRPSLSIFVVVLGTDGVPPVLPAVLGIAKLLVLV